jgi:beta-lactamase regulating signal transducer with metallopeptidase domain/protocatechuate 3,4-dioxygenase beta subunit
MNTPLDRFIHWLADVHLLSSLLLLAGLMIVYRLKQPALRMAVARSIVAGLATLAVVVAAPSWPRTAWPQWLGEKATPSPRTAMLPIELDISIPPDSSRLSVETPIAVVPPVSELIAQRSVQVRSTPILSLPGWRSILLAAYAIGVTLNLAWLALGAIQAARLRQSVRVADSRIPILMAKVSGDARDTTRVCLSTRIGLPVAIGVVRPMIVLPEQFAENETDEGLEAALAHELAHIQNGDLFWLAVLRLLTMVFFAQPLFWLLRRTIRADQEALADAAASTLHGDGRLAYAETLVGWARSANGVRPGALASAALALWERPSLLTRRVSVLLDPDIHIEPTLSRRWRLGATCLGLIGALALSLFSVRPIAATAQVMKAQSIEKNAPSAAQSKGNEMSERFEYAGRVLDPDGKPVVGAMLHLTYFGYRGKCPPPVRATSDPEGRFHFEVTEQDFSDADYDKPWTTAIVVASQKEELGLGWADAGERADVNASDEKKIDRLNLTLRLVPDDRPISGRIVDLQGHPVAGVSIEPNEILEPEGGDLSTWIADSRSGQGGSYELERKYLTHKLRSRGSGLPNPIMTDADGQFSIQGVGRERLVRLKLSGPTVQTKEILVLSRTGDPFSVTHARGSTDWGVSLYYGAQFIHAAAPTKPVVGVVKDKDTGKPLAGVRIECDKTAEYPVSGPTGIETTTDQNGRYRLVGLPKGRGNHVAVIPGKDMPYLRAGLEVPDSPGLEPVVFDFSLTRGIVIEGRVTDQVTGKPLKAYVDYNAYQDNPNLSAAPGFAEARVRGKWMTEPDGSFRLVGLPGRGLLSAAYVGRGDEYLTGVGLPEGLNQDKPLPIVPNAMQMMFNSFALLELHKSATTVRHDLALQEGVTRTVRVIGPDGNPVAGALIKFLPNIGGFGQPQNQAEFELQALRPKEIRVVEACHDGLKLAGLVEVHADNKEIAVLKLQPWGTVIGTLVDQDGQPRANVDLALDKRVENLVATDSKGRFRLEGLVPNRSTEIWVFPKPAFVSGTLGKPVVLAPGEIRDLGEVREKKYGG